MTTSRAAGFAVPGRSQGAAELRPRLVVDVVVGGVIAVLAWLPTAVSESHPGLRVLGVGLAVVVAAAVTARWRWPVLAVVVVFLATVVATALGVTGDPFLAAAWALYPLAVARGDRSRTTPLVVVAVLGVAALLTGTPEGTDRDALARSALFAVAALSGSWLLGTAAGRQLAIVAEVHRAQTQQRISEVQLHTAREVHDVVAHTLGTIGADAGVSRVLLDADEGELREALARIEVSSRRALEQVQVLVRGLRPYGPGPTRAPTPGAGEIPALIEQARAQGVAACFQASGTGELGALVGSAVYRIVQESLANVVRHAPGARCEVVLRITVQDVSVTVTDDGPGMAVGAVEGLGLTGIRERVALAGGRTWIADRPGAGVTVRVVLPREGAGT